MNRVVVTGFGAINSIGHTADESWKAALAGTSGVAPITAFDIEDFPVKVAAEIKDFEFSEALNKRTLRRNDRYQWIAQVASKEALDHSGLEITDENRSRIGVIISSGVGGMETMIEQIIVNHEEGNSRVNPFTIPKIMSNGASGSVSIEHGLCGPSFAVTSACASASDGIGMSLQLLRYGMADVMVSGGAEASITSFAIACFNNVNAASRAEDNTPRPFSADRDGLVMGESATTFILETLDHAQTRGATIYAELLGYGSSSDAYHITAPTEDGSGSAAAITNALQDAKVKPEEIDYINAHGTGTSLNDAAETLAVKLALGEEAYNIPMSSTKSMTGHCMGATGAVEALFCIKAIHDNAIPPTINYTEPDDVCDLDYVPNEARDHGVKLAISNSFGFGGHNSVLVLKEFVD